MPCNLPEWELQVAVHLLPKGKIPVVFINPFSCGNGRMVVFVAIHLFGTGKRQNGVVCNRNSIGFVSHFIVKYQIGNKRRISFLDNPFRMFGGYFDGLTGFQAEVSVGFITYQSPLMN